MSNAGQVVPTEVWADTSAQLDCESAPAFGLPQCCGALSSWHPLPYSWNLSCSSSIRRAHPIHTLSMRGFQDPRCGLCSLGYVPLSRRCAFSALSPLVLRGNALCPGPLVWQSHALLQLIPLGMPSFRPLS